MNLIKSSLIFNMLNKLDIQENTQIAQAVNESFIIKKLGYFTSWLQEKTSKISEISRLIKAIDYLILFVVSLAILSIAFSSTGIIGLLILAAFGLLLVKFCFVKDTGYNLTAFDIPIFLYIAIAGLSVTFSSYFFPSLKGYIKMLVYFSGYLTFASILKDHPKRVVYLMGLLAFSASIEAAYAIYQQITGIEPLAAWQDETDVNPEQLMNRVYGTLKPFNPNLLAGYLVASFSSALGMAFYFLNSKKFRLSALSFAGMLAILVAIVFTGSRGAYVATAAMLSVFVLISGHMIYHEYNHIKWLKKLWLGGIIVGVLGIICLVLISPALQHRVESIFALRGDSSNSFRLNVYASSFKMFLDNWLIGIGPGNNTFRLVYGFYMITGFDALGTYCVPLEVAVESGVFGFLAFASLIILSIIGSIKYLHRDNLLENKILVSSCLIGIIGMIVHGFVDTVWYRPQINVIFWLLIAILAAILSNKSIWQKK